LYGGNVPVDNKAMFALVRGRGTGPPGGLTGPAPLRLYDV